jgi:hypothetical protein
VGELRPEEYKAFYRCAVWTTEQLEEEVAAGNWFLAEATPDYIFQLESDLLEPGKPLLPSPSSTAALPSPSSTTTATTTATTQPTPTTEPIQTSTDPMAVSSTTSSLAVIAAPQMESPSVTVTKNAKKDDSEKKNTKQTYRIRFWKQTLELMGGEYAHIAQFPELDSIPADLSLGNTSEA